MLGSPHTTLLSTLMGECNLEKVNRLQCMEGMVPLWEEGLTERLVDLRCLLLNSCGLATIPPGGLTFAEELLFMRSTLHCQSGDE
jgi:hypothetical protein